ncbi:MAG: hypothetical protein GY863_09460 [bacterium]|nr:hypothetical protein [bacterium]
MNYKNLVLTVLLCFLVITSANAQEEDREQSIKGSKQSDIFLNLSTKGFGGGYKRHFEFRNQDTKLSFGVQVAKMHEPEAYAYYDPYFGYIRQNPEFFLLSVPIIVGVKKRLWRDKIEDSLRPFIIGEVGPVFGLEFPRGGGFTENLTKLQVLPTVRAFLGIGLEFGDTDERSFGVTFGVHVMEFFDKFGPTKSYSGIDFRFNFIKNIY